jgi:hypothetical protein
MKARHLKKALKKEAAIQAEQKSAKLTWREKRNLALFKQRGDFRTARDHREARAREESSR